MVASEQWLKVDKFNMEMTCYRLEGFCMGYKIDLEI